MVRFQASRRTVVQSALALSATPLARNTAAFETSDDPVSARPFPQHVAYFADAIMPNHVSQEEMDAAVLRHYDAWIRTYVRTEGGVGAWIDFDESGATVSEGMGYAMVLAAYLGDKIHFDAFFAYVQNHPSIVGPHLMAWKQQLIDGQMVDVEGPESATDGDLDIAYGLLLANAQWGSNGAVDYLAAARNVLADTLEYVVNSELLSLTVGDWIGTDENRYTRSSDFMTGHMLAFAEVDAPNRGTWQGINQSFAEAVNDVYANEGQGTGLMPDFLIHKEGRWRPVPGQWLETEHDGDTYWNASRTPWRLAMSWLLGGRDESLLSQQSQCKWIQEATGGDPRNVMSGYCIVNGELGEPIEKYADLAFVAPFAVNAMTGGTDAQEWLNRLWDAITGEQFPEVYGYFGDAIRLHVLLTVSGNWWAP